MSSKVRYHRLSQSVDSDEEPDNNCADQEEDEDEGFEENILFDSRLANTPVMERGEVFELERLGQPRVIGSSRERYLQARRKRICLIVLIVLSICLIAVAAVLFPVLNHAFNHGVVHHIDNTNRTSENWSQTFNGKWCESSVRMLDIDGDGLDDILLGVTKTTDLQAALRGTDMRAHCDSSGTGYPCGGELLALGGLDGAELWRCETRSTILYTVCSDVDVNADEQTDCIVTGRHATLQAVGVKSGRALWAADPDHLHWSTHLVSTWTVYGAVSLPDLDGDGVLDLAISHGEDETEETESPVAGRLVLISGKSGRPIGNSYLDIPGGWGTSTTPVKYITNAGAVYILFGSGNKISPGNLMAISLPDLYKTATGEELSHQNKDLYHWISSQQVDNNGVAFLTRQGSNGSEKGVVSPPVLIDADGDGTTDILVTEFGGRITLLDGAKLLEKWSRSFEGSEIIGSPTPGHFNTDIYLDFLIHVNIGVWDTYNCSKTLILNGADGSTLWSVEGSRSGPSTTDLSLRTSTVTQSAFLVNLVGRNSSLDASTPYPGLDIMKRYFSDTSSDLMNLPVNISAEDFQKKCDMLESSTLSDEASCDQNLDYLKVEVLLFDHLTRASPLQVLEVEATRRRYLLDHKRGDPHCHALTGRLRPRIGMCAVLTPITSTGKC
ncbi:CG6184, isoform E [Elysia marginata]|uniref:CG6184, isoform E n=1 Tax=Elysia marginata TaxID=1093978 RepID=A0AAV4GVJ2_9GAST|nr:CG6184, isoform E [Elysia marginata]